MNANSEEFSLFEYLGDEAAITALNHSFAGELTFSHPVTDRVTWSREIESGLSRASFDHLFEDLLKNCPAGSEFIATTK